MRRRIPIAVFLGSSIGALLAVPLAIVIIYLSWQAREIIGNQVQLEAQQRAEHLRDVADGHLDEIEQFARAAQSGVSALQNPDDKARLLSAVLQTRTMPTTLWFGDRIFILDEAGQISTRLAQSSPQTPETDGWSINISDGALRFNVITGPSKEPLSVIVYPKEWSQRIAGVVDPARQSAFVLLNDETVVAHSSWATPGTEPKNSVSLAAVDDLDLRNIWTVSDEFWPMREDAAHLARGESRMRAFIYERTARPDISLTVGYHTQASIFGAAFAENFTLAIVAAGVLIASVIAGVLISLGLSRPIQRLATAARQIEGLSIESLPHLKQTPMRELDDANRAFLSAFRALGAFAKFVPRDVVRQVMDGSAVGVSQTEKRSMSIMFTDLAGFTSIAKRNPPEKTAELLNDHFAMITSIIDREGGTVDKFVGDGVMAFWGAPTHQPDHADRALRAANAIAETFGESADAELRLRVGICSGDVLVGLTGSEVRMNYTVIGDPVNVAARLQELGKEVAADARTAVLVSGPTIHAAQTEAQWTDLGERILRGRDEPIQIYCLTN